MTPSSRADWRTDRRTTTRGCFSPSLSQQQRGNRPTSARAPQNQLMKSLGRRMDGCVKPQILRRPRLLIPILRNGCAREEGNGQQNLRGWETAPSRCHRSHTSYGNQPHPHGQTLRNTACVKRSLLFRLNCTIVAAKHSRNVMSFLNNIVL